MGNKFTNLSYKCLYVSIKFNTCCNRTRLNVNREKINEILTLITCDLSNLIGHCMMQ